jgi:CHAT domain-containing protein
MECMKPNLTRLFLLFCCFPIVAETTDLKLEENFEAIYNNYDVTGCNKDYYSFVESTVKLKKYLLKDNTYQVNKLSENDLIFIQNILIDFCNPIDSFNNYISNLDQILNSESSNKDVLLALHLWNLPPALLFTETENLSSIYDVTISTITLIRKNVNKLNINNNWDLSISSLYNSVEFASASEYSEIVSDDANNKNYTNFLLLSSLENLILESINPTISNDNLRIIATVLMKVRIQKIIENKYFGTSADDYLLREEFYDLYLNKFKIKSIKYTEFYNIFADTFSEYNLNNKFIEIDLDLDNLNDLISMAIDTGTTNNTSNDEIKYMESLISIMADKFDDDPNEIISNSFFATGMISQRHFKSCAFNDKSIIKNKTLNYFSNSAQLNYLKFTCSENPRYYQAIIKNLLTGFDLIKDNSVNLSLDDDSIARDFIQEAAVLIISLFTFTSYDASKYTLNQKDLNILSEITKKMATKFKSSDITTGNDLISNGVFDTLIYMLRISSLGDINYENNIKKIEEDISIKFKPDLSLLKNQLSELISDFDSDNANDIFMFARAIQYDLKIFINNYFDNKNYYWPTKIVDDIASLNSDDEVFKELISKLELITYAIDSLDDFFKGPDYFLFIFKDQSLDKWYLFRDLVPLEIYINYILLLSNKITFDQYQSITEKRTNQLLKIRPNNIAMQKFRDELLESNYHKPIRNLLKNYDETHKLFSSVRDSQFIISSEKQEFIKKDISDLKFEYKFKLNDIESALFSDEHIDIRPSLFSFESHDIKSIQNMMGIHELIISPVIQPDSMLGYINYITKFSVITVPLFEPIGMYSDKLLEKYIDPSSENFKSYAIDLYHNLLGPIEEVLPSDVEITDIYIVPDVSIQKLPFHALFDYKNDQWSVEKYNFKYLSSEKLYLYLNEHKVSRKDSFFGIGNPSLNKNTIKSQLESYFSERTEININNIKELPELPETEQELVNIGNFFNNKKLYFQNEANEKLLYENQFKNSDVMAFATHSVRGVNNTNNDRGLVLTPGDIGDVADDGFLGSLDVGTMKFNNDPLVMLSACNTIDSPYYSSLPFSGLPKSFMNAGANSMLISLWNIDSYSAKIFNESLFDKGIFTRSFYLSDSIQDSMIDMIGSKQHSHPYYWAPYIYLGK